jgi:predicted DNA-binding transcriptional regulator AlpA
MEDKKVFSEKEAASYVGVSESTLKKARLYRQSAKQTYPPYFRFGRSIRYRMQDLERWMDLQVNNQVVAFK